ncbi:uncharacterized protein L969DRAFT_97213 [Mixia osmundae IAM 14324]|uniref:uncharacterized protein n=1 Tax=Mixia osmundae (strain CBS 9802 / IAM 14324 / JCM 22182 / KY 12970) TaxID=764103 RepID=UPI0004A54DE9|nr:uncharacterized protein L969DRAFT_97213 [Mixia osmundae IAM 14324]KEI36476.1 hypothetical protein L969DRAFT_97213 [Mixia osmundae IAM 14324]
MVVTRRQASLSRAGSVLYPEEEEEKPGMTQPVNTARPNPVESTHTRQNQVNSVDDAPRATQASFTPGSTEIKFYDEEYKKLQRGKSSAKPSRSGPDVRSKRRNGWLSGWLAKGTALYLLAAYALVCSNDPNSTHSVCRGFNGAEHHASAALKKLKPHLSPYLAHADPYLDRLQPYTDRAEQFVKPINDAYETHVHPRVLKLFSHTHQTARPWFNHAHKQYKSNLHPTVSKYQKLAAEVYELNIDPHVNTASSMAKQYSDQAYSVVSPAYTSATNVVRKSVPVAQQYVSAAQPHIVKTYETTRDTYTTHVHPLVIDLSRHSGSFLQSKILPWLRRFHSLYIKPQTDKIYAKVFEYKTAKVASDVAADAEEEIKLFEEVSDSDEDEETVLLELKQDVSHDAEGLADGAVDADAIIPDTATPVPAQDPAVSEKRHKVESALATYEKEIDQLALRERNLLIQRLTALRNSASSDIPARFEPRLREIQDDATGYLSKLAKYFSKLTDAAAKEDVDSAVADAQTIVTKALSKISRRSDSIAEEIDEYRRTQTQLEVSAVDKAFKGIQTLVATAQEEAGHSLTWLEDVTAVDWTRYHALGESEKKWAADFRALQSGQKSDPALSKAPNTISTLAELQSELDTIVETFETRLKASRSVGISAIKGEGVVNRAKGAAAAVSSVYAEATAAVVSAAGGAITTPAASGYSASAESVYSDLADTATSLLSKVADAAPTAVVAGVVADIYESASSVLVAGTAAASSQVYPNQGYVASASSQAHQAYRSVQSAVGLEPSPEGLTEHASSVYNAAASAAAAIIPTDVQGSAASVASVASASLSSVANYGQASAASAASVLSASGASAVSVASVSAASIASLASASASSAASAASAAITSRVIPQQGYVAAVSSQAHEAIRSAQRAAGIEPSPEGIVEHATSAYKAASSAAGSAAGDAQATLVSIASSLSKSLPGVPDVNSAQASVSSVVSVAQASGASLAAAAQSSGVSAASVASASISSAASVASASAVSAASSLSKSAPSLPSVDVAKSASSVYSAASASVVSAASAASSSLPSIDAQNVYREAQKVVGIKPSPQGIVESVKSVASSAYEAVPSADAAQAIHEATRAASRAVGATPTPENIQEHATSVLAAAEDALASASSAAAQAAEQAAQAIRRNYNRVEFSLLPRVLELSPSLASALSSSQGLSSSSDAAGSQQGSLSTRQQQHPVSTSSLVEFHSTAWRGFVLQDWLSTPQLARLLRSLAPAPAPARARCSTGSLVQDKHVVLAAYPESSAFLDHRPLTASSLSTSRHSLLTPPSHQQKLAHTPSSSHRPSTAPQTRPWGSQASFDPPRRTAMPSLINEEEHTFSPALSNTPTSATDLQGSPQQILVNHSSDLLHSPLAVSPNDDVASGLEEAYRSPAQEGGDPTTASSAQQAFVSPQHPTVVPNMPLWAAHQLPLGMNVRNTRPMTAPSYASAPYFGAPGYESEQLGSYETFGAPPFGAHHQPYNISHAQHPSTSMAGYTLVSSGQAEDPSSLFQHNIDSFALQEADDRMDQLRFRKFSVPDLSESSFAHHPSSLVGTPSRAILYRTEYPRPDTATTYMSEADSSRPNTGMDTFSPFGGMQSFSPFHNPQMPYDRQQHFGFGQILGAHRKRARRRFDEIERLYDCNYPGCTKAYGTLNHLNAHISMQKHGPKRGPQEFKDIRKEWRARKKAEESRSKQRQKAGGHQGHDMEASGRNGIIENSYYRPMTAPSLPNRRPSLPMTNTASFAPVAFETIDENATLGHGYAAEQTFSPYN